MIIAVTLLSEYQYCPRKIYFSRVLKIKLPPTEALVKGKIRHQIEEEASIRFNYIISTITKGDFEFIYEKFKSEYLQLILRTIKNNIRLINKVQLKIDFFTSELIKTFNLIAKQSAEYIHELILKHKVLGKKILDYIETEQISETFIESKELQLKGIVDSIEFENENITPIEIKTGSMPNQGVWPSHKLQIGCYILLCEEKFDAKIDYGIVRYLDFNQDRKIQMNPFLKDEIITVRDKVIKLLESNEIPERLPEINKKINRKCISCLYKNKCYGTSS